MKDEIFAALRMTRPVIACIRATNIHGQNIASRITFHVSRFRPSIYRNTPAGPLLAAALREGEGTSGSAVTDGDDAHGGDLGGQVEQGADGVQVVRSGEARGQTLVHHSQQQYHTCRSNIEVPIWHRPFDFGIAGFQLVRLPVAAVVSLLACAGHYQHGAPEMNG